MAKRHPILRDLISLFALITACHALCLLMGRRNMTAPTLLPLWIWLGVQVLTYTALVPGGEDRRILSVILVLSPVLQILLNLRMDCGPGSLMGWLWLLLLWGITLHRCSELAAGSVKKEQHLLDFEISVLVGILMILCFAGGLFPLPCILPSLISCSLSLLGLSVDRLDSRSAEGRKGWALPVFGVPVLLIGGLMLLLSPLFSFFSRSVQWLERSGFGLFRALGILLYRIFLFLVSLFPAAEEEPLVLTEEASTAMNLEGAAAYDGGFFLVPALILLLLTGALLILLGLRHRRPAGKTTGAAGSRQHRLPGDPFQFLRGLPAKIRFLLRYLTRRNSPEGIYLRIRFRMSPTADRKQVWESPGRFLDRLAEKKPEAAEELNRLAFLLEQQYYAPETAPADRAELTRISHNLRKQGL